MDQNVRMERVMCVRACAQCGVPQTFISRLRGEMCAICGMGLRLMRSDAEVELLRRFARELWALRSLEPVAVEPVVAAPDGWAEKIRAWAGGASQVTLEGGLEAVGIDPTSATAADRKRVRELLRALGHVVRAAYAGAPQGLVDVQAALQRLGKAEVTISELLPPESQGDRRRIKIVARCLAYLGWTAGARGSIGAGKRATVFRAPTVSPSIVPKHDDA